MFEHKDQKQVLGLSAVSVSSLASAGFRSIIDAELGNLFRQASREFQAADQSKPGHSFQKVNDLLDAIWTKVGAQFCRKVRENLTKTIAELQEEDVSEEVASYTALLDRVPEEGKKAKGMSPQLALELFLFKDPRAGPEINLAVKALFDCYKEPSIATAEAIIDELDGLKDRGLSPKSTVSLLCAVCAVTDDDTLVDQKQFALSAGYICAMAQNPQLRSEHIVAGLPKVFDALQRALKDEQKLVVADPSLGEYHRTLLQKAFSTKIIFELHYPEIVSDAGTRAFLRQHQVELLRLLREDPAQLISKYAELSENSAVKKAERLSERIENFVRGLRAHGTEVSDHDLAMLQVYLPSNPSFSTDELAQAWREWVAVRDS